MTPSPPASAQDTLWDLIVIGAGAHGLMAACMAAETGQRVLLLDRGRVGGATSAAWFRILHGGLRYLQTLDVARLRQSVVARRGWLAEFPDEVAIRPFLMPLYGRGMKRALAFRAAFLAERVLTADRNRGVPSGLHLPPGRVIGPDETRAHYPGVALRDPGGRALEGAALWYEAVARSATGLATALAARARDAGVAIVEGAEATGLAPEGGPVTGATGVIGVTGRLLADAPVPSAPGAALEAEAGAPADPPPALPGQGGATWRDTIWHGTRVLNMAGPWAETLACRLDPAAPPPGPVALGFNLTLDRPPPAQTALALAVPGQNAMLFVQPDWDRPESGRCFAGTWYAPRPEGPTPARITALTPDMAPGSAPGSTDAPAPREAEIVAFLAALNAACPGLAADPGSICEVTAGLLPALPQPASDPANMTLAGRDRIHNHATQGGPTGLITVTGVKLTTAEAVARAALAI